MNKLFWSLLMERVALLQWFIFFDLVKTSGCLNQNHIHFMFHEFFSDHICWNLFQFTSWEYNFMISLFKSFISENNRILNKILSDYSINLSSLIFSNFHAHLMRLFQIFTISWFVKHWNEVFFTLDQSDRIWINFWKFFAVDVHNEEIFYFIYHIQEFTIQTEGKEECFNFHFQNEKVSVSSFQIDNIEKKTFFIPF
jgi:hypothetical protein